MYTQSSGRKLVWVLHNFQKNWKKEQDCLLLSEKYLLFDKVTEKRELLPVVLGLHTLLIVLPNYTTTLQ